VKVCKACGEEKDETEFYRSAIQIMGKCKACWNDAAMQRAPRYRVKQRAAKKAWQVRHPERKRIHEGRAIFLGRPESPPILVAAERALVALTLAARRGVEPKPITQCSQRDLCGDEPAVAGGGSHPRFAG